MWPPKRSLPNLEVKMCLKHCKNQCFFEKCRFFFGGATIYIYYIIEPHVMFVTHQVKPGSLGTVTRCRTLVNPPGVTWPRFPTKDWGGDQGFTGWNIPRKRLDFNSLNHAWILHCLLFVCFSFVLHCCNSMEVLKYFIWRNNNKTQGFSIKSCCTRNNLKVAASSPCSSWHHVVVSKCFCPGQVDFERHSEGWCTLGHCSWWNT